MAPTFTSQEAEIATYAWRQKLQGPMQKTHWRNIYSTCWKVWWLHNGRSQSPDRGVWISEQSSIRSRGAGLSHSVETILSVQNQNFSRDREKLTIVSWTRKPKVIYTNNSFEFWQILWRNIVESPNFDTSSIWNEWYCGTSCTTSSRRNISSIVAIRSGWKMVGWFHGMLLLSAKCARPHGRREHSKRKAIRRVIQKTDYSVWSDGRILSVCSKRSSNNSPIW